MDESPPRGHSLGDMATVNSSKFGGAGAFAVDRIEAAIDSHLARSDLSQQLVTLTSQVPDTALGELDAVLDAKLSYRDVLLIQLAWGLDEDSFDHTLAPAGARSASKQVTGLLTARHINARKEVYQTLGKGRSNVLTAGPVEAFNHLLARLNAMTADERAGIFQLLTARMAITARPVEPMPVLARADLTFVRVSGFLDALLSSGSLGVYQQYAVAAFLSAVIEEFGLGGVGGLRVETKNINATDASSGTAADVQIMRGGKVEEAFEVSASDFRPKVGQAITAARNAELPRAHVLAYGENLEQLGDLLENSTTDVTLMDVRHFLRVMVGIMKKPAREEALRKLYDLIDQKQTDVELVNRYVALLSRHALTA